MRNQFFYTRTVQTQAEGTEGVENVITSTFRDSLNLEMVIRSVTLPTGEVVILLNDVHEQYQQVPNVNTETNVIESYREVRTNVQSEITLSVSDGRRFFEVTNVENVRGTSYEQERSDILKRSDVGSIPAEVITVVE